MSTGSVHHSMPPQGFTPLDHAISPARPSSPIFDASGVSDGSSFKKPLQSLLQNPELREVVDAALALKRLDPESRANSRPHEALSHHAKFVQDEMRKPPHDLALSLAAILVLRAHGMTDLNNVGMQPKNHDGDSICKLHPRSQISDLNRAHQMLGAAAVDNPHKQALNLALAQDVNHLALAKSEEILNKNDPYDGFSHVNASLTNAVLSRGQEKADDKIIDAGFVMTQGAFRPDHNRYQSIHQSDFSSFSPTMHPHAYFVIANDMRQHDARKAQMFVQASPEHQNEGLKPWGHANVPPAEQNVVLRRQNARMLVRAGVGRYGAAVALQNSPPPERMSHLDAASSALSEYRQEHKEHLSTDANIKLINILADIEKRKAAATGDAPHYEQVYAYHEQLRTFEPPRALQKNVLTKAAFSHAQDLLGNGHSVEALPLLEIAKQSEHPVVAEKSKQMIGDAKRGLSAEQRMSVMPDVVKARQAFRPEMGEMINRGRPRIHSGKRIASFDERTASYEKQIREISRIGI